MSRQLRKAIERVQDAGMKVYVPGKARENEFMKVYVDGLEKMLNDVSGNSFKVFFALVSELDYSTNQVKLTREEIMSKTKLSKNTVVKSLDELEKSGFIKRLGSSINRSYQLSELMVRKGKKEN
ncbi:MAG: replication/maintenance protein RepL [Crocosphaera sp.]